VIRWTTLVSREKFHLTHTASQGKRGTKEWSCAMYIKYINILWQNTSPSLELLLHFRVRRIPFSNSGQKTGCPDFKFQHCFSARSGKCRNIAARVRIASFATLQHQYCSSFKSIGYFLHTPRCCVRKDGPTVGQIDTTRLIVTFSNFANPPKNPRSSFSDKKGTQHMSWIVMWQHD